MNETTAFTLACRDGHGQPPVLRDVAATARLDGALFELTLRQTYRNTGTQLLEVIYTFPLLPRGVLLGFATELNGARLQGTMLPRGQAEQKYENALADGDAPVMLEVLGDSLHTANIGNLKPGDEIVVEVRMAQVVALEQGRLRLAIPSTIAPRYGNPSAAGLQPQQVPVASLSADYPLALSLHVTGALADAAIACPTHRVVSRRTDAGLEIALAPEARLDRDVVLVVTPAAATEAIVTQSHDARSADARTVLLATLPVPEAPRRAGIALKLLVDCSGSMGGDSMVSARRALNGIAALLGPADAVSLTRFGTTFEHVCPLAWCTPPTVRRLVQDIGTTDANLGGTEMEGALSAVFAIPGDIPPRPPGEQLRGTAARHPGGGIGDVLLITDGEVWDVDGIIATARRAAQRVFVIGVGASPAEGALRRLAQATGGACEFATPGEALEAAAQRMLARIRQQAWSGLRIDWGVAAAWQGELPLNAFAGDTLAVFAGVPGAPRADLPVRLVSRSADGVDVVLAATATRSVAAGDALPRVAAAGRLAGLPDEAATRLAVDYQLMSRYTNCVLVHLRAEADKATDEAQLHRVEGMLAAGWGASASVLASADMSDLMGSPAMAAPAGGGAFAKRAAAPVRLRTLAAAVPQLQREAERGLAPSAEAAMAGAPASVAGPSMTSEDFQRRYGATPLTDLADLVADHLGKGGSLGSLDERARSLHTHADLRAALDAVIGLGIGSSIAWTLLILWLDDQLQRDVSSALSDAARLRAARLDPAIRAQAAKRFDQLRLRVLPGQAAVA